MAKKTHTRDRKFQELAAQVNRAIIKNDGLIGDQKEQVELMFSLERKFQFYVQKHAKTVNIYNKFINFIVKDKGNILSAKSYFREKLGVFNSHIANHIRDGRGDKLKDYKINYLLIRFIADNWGGKFPNQINNYYLEYVKARKVLIENNIPLAINRAKLFYRKTPKTHLGLLDLIDICVCGLVTGIDKYVGGYTTVWRSVCIGRMVGYMIEEYSSTFLRLYPTDRKVLYRINSLRYRLKIEDVGELTDKVNQSFERDRERGKKTPPLPINEGQVRTLLNSVNYIPTDSKKDNGENGGQGENDGVGIYDYTPDPSQNIEKDLIKKDAMEKVIETSEELDLIEKKIIRLKGVDL